MRREKKIRHFKTFLLVLSSNVRLQCFLKKQQSEFYKHIRNGVTKQITEKRIVSDLAAVERSCENMTTQTLAPMRAVIYVQPV